MEDKHDQTQVLPIVKDDELKIPTEQQHNRLIVRLWIACIATAGGVFVLFGGIVLVLFLKGYDPKRVVEVSTAVFQVLSMTAGVGFFIPLGLTSIVTLLLGIRMNRRSIGVLDKLDSAVESRLNKIDGLLGKAERVVQMAEAGEMPEGLSKLILDAKKFVIEQLKLLRDDIRGARTSAEEELSNALDQGELEAAAAPNGLAAKDLTIGGNYLCGVCQSKTHGADDPCPQCRHCATQQPMVRCGLLHSPL